MRRRLVRNTEALYGVHGLSELFDHCDIVTVAPCTTIVDGRTPPHTSASATAAAASAAAAASTAIASAPPPRYLYLLDSGYVSSSLQLAGELRHRLAKLLPGEVFGLSNFLQFTDGDDQASPLHA